MTRTSKYLLSLISLFLLGPLSVASADMLSDLKKAGVVRIGAPQDNPPFGMPGADMKIVGYDIDMAELLGRKLGMKVDLVYTTSGNRVPFIQSRRIDIIVASLGKNPDREKVLDFSERYAPFFIGIYSSSDVAISKVDDLVGKTVGVTRGANEDLEITKIAPAGTTIQRFDDIAGQLAAFSSGQIDIIVTSNTAAAAMSRQSSSRVPVLRISLKESPCFVGVPKGETALLGQINEVIREAKADGTLSAMSKKWFQTDLPANF